MDYQKIEEEAIKKLKSQKSKMKVSGKSVFILKKASENQKKK